MFAFSDANKKEITRQIVFHVFVSDALKERKIKTYLISKAKMFQISSYLMFL